MRMYDVIMKKRGGGALTPEEIAFFVKGYTDGSIPDYQASALTMAIYFKGMTDEETVNLTLEMAKSGDMVDLSRFGKLSCDKHSTGGVGDKTTLIVAPTVAALGGKLAKMSGRGLGHTGGTVDKLESISGYQTTQTAEDFFEQVEKIGISVIGQSGNLAPADKKLYALRDVTATVDSIPLITSSIMSKKIAAGSHNIVLDVKVGSGAFMKTLEDAETLATSMVNIGKGCGRNVSAVLTDMDCPLGSNVGNSLEVIEAVEVLKGEKKGDLYSVSMTLAAELVSKLNGIDFDDAYKMCEECIKSGKAFSKMREWIALQGGDTSAIDNPDLFKKAPFSLEVKAQKSGFVTEMNAEQIGNAAAVLGAGRVSKTDEIDHSAGIIINKKVSDKVVEGESLCTLFTSDKLKLSDAENRYLSAVKIGNTYIERKPLVYKIIR